MKITFDSLPDVIWGEMYGRPCTDPDAILVDIKKTRLEKTKVDDAVWYIWGWPGPDMNCYKYSDYGVTWAFTPEELAPAVTWKEKWEKENEM